MTVYVDYMIVGGVRVPVDARVRTWEYTGMQFVPGVGANKRRRKDIPLDLAVVHWTGGENSGASFFRNITRRGLGSEFFVDADGVLWQFADPLEVDTADCGAFNYRSLGFEVQSYGFRRADQKAPAVRDESMELIHDRELLCARFYESQKKTLRAALEALAGSGRVAFQMEAPAESLTSVYPRSLPARFVRSFQGVVGHFHLSEEKTDPGLDFFDSAFSAGWLTPRIVEAAPSSTAPASLVGRTPRAKKRPQE